MEEETAGESPLIQYSVPFKSIPERRTLPQAGPSGRHMTPLVLWAMNKLTVHAGVYHMVSKVPWMNVVSFRESEQLTKIALGSRTGDSAPTANPVLRSVAISGNKQSQRKPPVRQPWSRVNGIFITDHLPTQGESLSLLLLFVSLAYHPDCRCKSFGGSENNFKPIINSHLS